MRFNPGCTLCGLHKTARTVCLWGEQAEKSKPTIMVLGEAPGREEDIVGRPFIGKSGTALRQVLDDLGLLRSCYITNCVKCRPPDNATPLLPQIRKCAPYWQEEFAQIRPRFLVLLGATAIRAVTGEKTVRVGEWRGRKNWQYEGANVIATYHPAACLRNDKLWVNVVDDFSRIKGGEFIAPEKIEVLPGFHVSLDKAALDLETEGLNPFAPDVKIKCVGTSWKRHAAQVALDPGGLLDLPRTLIGHNVKFDLLWMKEHWGLVHEGRVIDTMVMHHLLDENAPKHALKWIVQQLTGLGDYDQEIKLARDAGKWEEVPEPKMLEYCAWDAGATWLIYEQMLPEIKKQKLEKLLLAQGEVIKTLVAAESWGLEVDPARITTMQKALKRRMRKIEREITDTYGDINLGSPKQLGDLIYGTLGQPVLERTPGGLPSTSESSLQTLAQTCRDEKVKGLLASVLQYRADHKMIETYLNNLIEGMDEAHRVHPSFHITGTVTGRLSCSAPNLQNIPRDAAGPKSVICASEGFTLVQADYSQIELRVGASLSGDERMLSLLRSGEDLHWATARSLFGEGATKEDRSLAKTINFGIFYGVGPNHFAQVAGCRVGEAKQFISKWFMAYPRVREWLREVEQTVMSVGYVTSLFGRRRRLPTYLSDGADYQRSIRQACNFPVQSTAAELTLLAMTLLQEQLPEGACVVGNVHDAIMVECEEKLAPMVVKLMRDTMESPKEVGRHFGFKVDLGVPTPVEISVGRYWSEMQEVPRE